MTRYFWRNGRFEDSDGNPMPLPDGPIATPYVISDIPDYHSPIDGRLISGRAERRYDLESNNCVPYEPSMSPTQGKFRNKRFAKKWGMEVAEEFR
jgi:hypothetical protein